MFVFIYIFMYVCMIFCESVSGVHCMFMEMLIISLIGYRLNYILIQFLLHLINNTFCHLIKENLIRVFFVLQ